MHLVKRTSAVALEGAQRKRRLARIGSGWESLLEQALGAIPGVVMEEEDLKWFTLRGLWNKFSYAVIGTSQKTDVKLYWMNHDGKLRCKLRIEWRKKV